MNPYVNEHLCVRPASCLTHTSISTEGMYSFPPVGGEERVSNHHVHRLPVTLPYAPAVGLLITSVCDSRTAKLVRTRRLGSGGRGGGVNSPFSCECMSVRDGKEGNFVVILA